MHINDLLATAVARGASDLHMKVGSFPMLRIDGTLTPATETKRLEKADMDAVAASLLSPEQRDKFQKQLEVDVAYAVPNLGRFRCNVFQQRGTIGLVMRVIPSRVPTVDELQLPPVLKKIADEERGLILVTGTTGSGKSTTLAAMLNHINNARPTHIMTVEDPIEYLHRDNKSIINQREIRTDTGSFSMALRSALRQDPDVILVGEMRDLETVETALLAAETGHLVFSTLHTLDAPESINRIVAVFPPHQQRQVRLQLASILKAVVSQRLMPRANGARPCRRRRSHDRDAVHPGLHPGQGQDALDSRRDRRRHVAVRHADVRPVDLRALQAGRHQLRRRAALRDQPGRVQAQGPGDRHDVGDGAPGDARLLAPGRRDLALRGLAHAHPASFGPADSPGRCSCVDDQSYTRGVDAYVLALGWLARRELTEKQIRQRLARRGLEPDAIDEAVARLKAERAIDDARVAGAFARTAVRLKGRGPMRLERDLQVLGIERGAAKAAVRDVLADTDEQTLARQALARRWRRADRPEPADAARLYRALLRQGFGSAARAALAPARPPPSRPAAPDDRRRSDARERRA